MKNIAVLFFNLDKLTKEEWKHIACDNGIMRSVYKIDEEDEEAIQKFLDDIQEKEAARHYAE